MVFEEAIWPVLTAIGGGIVFGVTGYLKSTEKDKSFSFMKIGLTAGLGAIVGLTSYVTGTSAVVAQDLLVSTSLYAGATAVLENVFKWLNRSYLHLKF